MESEQREKLIRSVDILTERSLNAAKVTEHIQTQMNSMSLKMDVILSQISQNSIENKEEHMGLKVSLKNKINDSINELKDHHNDDIASIKSNPMVKLGESKKLLSVVVLVVVLTFWQNIDSILHKLAKDHGIEPEVENTITAILPKDDEESVHEVTLNDIK